MSGRLIAVVGPSGVGKDSLIGALAQARPDWIVARRAITRPPDASEPFLSVSRDAFDRRAAAGAFALHWTAHGLRYGLPAACLDAVLDGRCVLANLSRQALPDAAARFPRVVVLSVTAPPGVLALRLGARGREDPAAIARRLARPAPPMPDGLAVVEIDNGGPLQAGVDAALRALDAVA